MLSEAKHLVFTHKLPYFPFLPIAVLLLSCSACNRPAWEDRSAARTQKIHDEWGRFAEHEAEGVDRLHRTNRWAHRMYNYHVEHFHQTGDFARGEIESDVTRWNEEREKRRDFAHRYFLGQPQTIPSTWAKMVY